MRLLVTRPEDDAERTAAALRARGHEVLLAPVLRTEILADADLGSGPFGAVVLTSANAVRAIARHPRRDDVVTRPAFVVGRRTAEAARAEGFGSITSADGNQDDLVRLIGARYHASAPLLYLAGEDRSGDLAGALATHGVTAQTVVLYRAVPAAFAPAVREALAGNRLDGVLHFSRRSAEAFLQCATAGGVRDTALALAHHCLSGQVAEPLRAAGASRVLIAPRPEENALIELVSLA
jgi:uroporphyrinogen-III synthase